MRILNLGSLNLDRVYDVDHFVRAGETISAAGYATFPGGKGLNQSIAAARAGSKVFHAGAIGTDGDRLKELLDETGVDTRYIRRTNGVSGHAIIQSCQGENSIIVFGGANREISCGQIDAVLQNFGEGDLLMLQNEISNLMYAVRQGKKRGMVIVLNPSPISNELLNASLEEVDYLILNEIEGRALCAKPDLMDDVQLLNALAEKYPRASIVLTVGSRGAYFCSGSYRLHHGIYAVPVVDTTAAGDTFSGFFITGLTQGIGPEACLEYASLAAALAVSKKGASGSIPTMAEVEEFRASR